MTTSTRYIGTCAACGREIKVRDGKLVHHGYERPGYGYIEGDCFGVHYGAHETSPKCAEDYRSHLATVLGAKLGELQAAPEKTELYVARSFPEKALVKIAKGDPGFEAELRYYIRRLEQTIEHIRFDYKRAEELLKDWTAQPLKTVEEEVAQKQADKEAREQARRDKGEAKIAAEVEKYRKRLASASRTKEASVFIQIFEGAPMKLNDAGGALISLSRKEVYERIGHVEVWQKLGLLDEAGEPVYVRQDGRYKNYNIPYNVRPEIEKAIKDGILGELKF